MCPSFNCEAVFVECLMFCPQVKGFKDGGWIDVLLLCCTLLLSERIMCREDALLAILKCKLNISTEEIAKIGKLISHLSPSFQEKWVKKKKTPFEKRWGFPLRQNKIACC